MCRLINVNVELPNLVSDHDFIASVTHALDMYGIYIENVGVKANGCGSVVVGVMVRIPFSSLDVVDVADRVMLALSGKFKRVKLHSALEAFDNCKSQ